MVHVSGDVHSGDAHLLQLPNGHVILIDTGFDRYTRSSLIPYLDNRGIKQIDDLIITHAHRNHYGGMISLLQHLKSIKRIYFNLPPEMPCDKENWAMGCDYQHVLKTRKEIEASGLKLRGLRTGQVLYDADGITLKVLYVHDGKSRPIGSTDINDTSAILRLVYGNTSVLFAADVNRSVGAYLAKESALPQSTFLTAPHHGVESAAPNEFLRMVKPEVFMVSNSAKQWLGKRGDRMRKFAAENKLRTYVTGLHGNVIVTLRRDGYSIATEKVPGSKH